MYGPGQSMPHQPVPPTGGQPGYGTGPAGHPHPVYGAGPPGQPQGGYGAQPRREERRGSRLLTLVAAAVLVVTGGVNAVSGPLGYVNNANIGVLILGGDPLFLAVAQTVCGVSWMLFGVLLLTGRRFPWGAALVGAGFFATFEAYFVVRGAVIHYVGLFLAVVVMALLYQDGVRRYCRIGPPAR